jgi:dTDP-4-dehydrorhamnose reductase
MKILILGGSGLLGSNWVYLASQNHSVATVVGKRSIDLPGVNVYRGLEGIPIAVESERPDIVINTIGFTNVNSCELNPLEALKLNAELPAELARLQLLHGFKLVHISTDHIFPAKERLWSEVDQPQPVNVYGRTKYLGEIAARSAESTLIVRTNFFGWGHRYRQSFSDWILTELRSHREIVGFTNVFYSPVLVDQLVIAVNELLENESQGVYNVSSSNVISKFDFIERVAQRFDMYSDRVVAGTLQDVGRVLRPRHMGLSDKKMKAEIGMQLDLDRGISLLLATSERARVLYEAVS